MSYENQSNSNVLSPQIDTLKNISKSLDIILDKPADQWSQKEINIYHLLQNTLDKYKIRYSLTQFKLDVNDIKKNVKSCQWYQDSPYQKTLSWILDQLVIKSYQHSKKNDEFRLNVRFTQSQIKLLIIKTAEFDQAGEPLFNYLIENEITNIKTKELNDIDNMIQIFGINKNIDSDKQHQIIIDIAKLLNEIGLFYN